VTDTLASQLVALRGKTVSGKKAVKVVLDPAAQERLGALGYAASAGNNLETDPDQGPDPKDKIEIANLHHRAEILHQEMHVDEAIVLMEQVVARNPSAALYTLLGNWLMEKEDYVKAVPAFRKSLEMDPDSSGVLFLLSKCLMISKDYTAAATELEKLVAKVPNSIQGHSYLELAYSQTKRLPEAIRECNITLQYVPDDYGSYLILGQSQARLGDPQAGIATLKKAASVEPDVPLAHLWLAEIYDQLGQKPDADRERAEADRLEKKNEREAAQPAPRRSR
jgi:tetratricopeptide (TPR) repeat protein